MCEFNSENACIDAGCLWKSSSSSAYCEAKQVCRIELSDSPSCAGKWSEITGTNAGLYAVSKTRGEWSGSITDLVVSMDELTLSDCDKLRRGESAATVVTPAITWPSDFDADVREATEDDDGTPVEDKRNIIYPNLLTSTVGAVYELLVSTFCKWSQDMVTASSLRQAVQCNAKKSAT